MDRNDYTTLLNCI